MPITHDIELDGVTLPGGIWWADGIGWSKDLKGYLLVRMAAYISESDRNEGKTPLKEATISIPIDFENPESASCQLFNNLRTQIYDACEADFDFLLSQGVVRPNEYIPPQGL